MLISLDGYESDLKAQEVNHASAAVGGKHFCVSSYACLASAIHLQNDITGLQE